MVLYRASLLALLLASGLGVCGYTQNTLLAQSPFDAETRNLMESLPCTWAALSGRVGPSYGSERFDFSCKAGTWGTVTLLLDAGETEPPGLNRIRLMYRDTTPFSPIPAQDAPVAEHFLQAILNRYVPAQDAQTMRQSFWSGKSTQASTAEIQTSTWSDKKAGWIEHWLEIKLPPRDRFPHSFVDVKQKPYVKSAPLGVYLDTDEPNRTKLDPVNIKVIGQSMDAGLLDAQRETQVAPERDQFRAPLQAPIQVPLTSATTFYEKRALGQRVSSTASKDIETEGVDLSPSILTQMPTAVNIHTPPMQIQMAPAQPTMPTDINVLSPMTTDGPVVLAVGTMASPTHPTEITVFKAAEPIAPEPQRGNAPQTLMNKLGNLVGITSSVTTPAPLPTKIDPRNLNTTPAPESLVAPTPPPVVSSSLVPTPEVLSGGRAPAPSNFSEYNKAEKLTRDIEQKAAQTTTGLMQQASPTAPVPNSTALPSLAPVPTPQVQTNQPIQAPTQPAGTPAVGTATGLTAPTQITPLQPTQPQPDPRFTPDRALPQLQFIPKAEPLDTRSDVIRFEDEGSGL